MKAFLAPELPVARQIPPWGTWTSLQHQATDGKNNTWVYRGASHTQPCPAAASMRVSAANAVFFMAQASTFGSGGIGTAHEAAWASAVFPACNSTPRGEFAAPPPNIATTEFRKRSWDAGGAPASRCSSMSCGSSFVGSGPQPNDHSGNTRSLSQT